MISGLCSGHIVCAGIDLEAVFAVSIGSSAVFSGCNCGTFHGKTGTKFAYGSAQDAHHAFVQISREGGGRHYVICIDCFHGIFIHTGRQGTPSIVSISGLTIYAGCQNVPVSFISLIFRKQTIYFVALQGTFSISGLRRYDIYGVRCHDAATSISISYDLDIRCYGSSVGCGANYSITNVEIIYEEDEGIVRNTLKTYVNLLTGISGEIIHILGPYYRSFYISSTTDDGEIGRISSGGGYAYVEAFQTIVRHIGTSPESYFSATQNLRSDHPIVVGRSRRSERGSILVAGYGRIIFQRRSGVVRIEDDVRHRRSAIGEGNTAETVGGGLIHVYQGPFTKFNREIFIFFKAVFKTAATGYGSFPFQRHIGIIIGFGSYHSMRRISNFVHNDVAHVYGSAGNFQSTGGGGITNRGRCVVVSMVGKHVRDIEHTVGVCSRGVRFVTTEGDGGIGNTHGGGVAANNSSAHCYLR